MSSSYGVRQRSRSVALLRMLALVAAAAAGGCTQSHDKPVHVNRGEDELALLLRDGKLPSEMAPPTPPPPPVVPPRFCGFPTFPGFPGVRPPPIIAGAPAPVPEADAGMPVDEPDMEPPSAAGAGGRSGAAGAPVAGGGAAGVGGIAGGGGFPTGPDPACASQPIATWTFDDCNEFRTDLSDSSFQGHTAFRSVELKCGAGKQGLAAKFATKDDVVYAPDQPAFALDFGVTIAGWVKPDAVSGTQTIFRKSEAQDSAFALLVHKGRYEFAVRLSSGRLASVNAPAKAGVWTHVAGTYDGTTVRLYIDGEEVDTARVSGVLARSSGPLLIGNDGTSRRFSGRIDNVWFNTQAAPITAIQQLLCLRVDPTVTVSPEVGPSVQAGTAVTYTLSIENNDDPRCPPAIYQVSSFAQEGNFTIEPGFQDVSVASGETASLDMSVRSGPEIEAGSYTIDFQLFSQSGGGIFFPPGVVIGGGPVVVGGGSGGAGAGDEAAEEEPIPPGPTGFVNVQARYVVAEPEGCHVSSQRELMIRDVSVVEDPVRTVMGGSEPNAGVWSFGVLMERLSPTPASAADNAEQMFRTFLDSPVVNGFAIPSRPPMDQQVLAAWPRTADGKLDLARAPMRLLAITHRLDLEDLAQGKAGEGRFTYGVLDPFGFPMEFTVIFEYALPARNAEESRAWVDRVHALQELPFPSAEYNDALQAVTDAFTGRGVLPGAPNGSALIDIRTNEIALSLDGQWQLREFRISAESGLMAPHPLFQTPDSSFNFSEALGRFINENEDIILTERHEVPMEFEGVPFATGAVFNNIDFWSAPNVNNPEARHKFSLNTCNGCHGAETQTGFLQIQPRLPGEASRLSGFLTGIDAFDPNSGQPRHFNELARRRALVEAQVCADEP